MVSDDVNALATQQSIKAYVDAHEGTSFGTVGQIPYTNAATDDFDYSADLIFDGTDLYVGNDMYMDGNGDYTDYAKLSTDANGALTITTVDVAGADADIAIINTEKTYIVDSLNFVSKGKNSPFHKWKLKGTVETTIAMGKVYDWRGKDKE